MFLPSPLDVRIVGTLPTDWPAVFITAGAGVLGAIVGGLISYMIAREGASQTKSALLAARRELEEAATVRTTTKLMELADEAAGYHLQIEREFQIYRDGHDGQQPDDDWLAMRPLVGKPKEINVTADDLVILVRSRNFDHLTKLMHLFSLYNSMIYGIEGYSARREALMEKITPEELVGIHGKVAMHPKQFAELLPKIITASTLAKQIRKEASEVFDLAIEVIKEFGPIAKAYFNDPKFPIPSVIAGADDKLKKAT